MKTKKHLILVIFSLLTLYTAQAFVCADSEKVDIEKQEPPATIIESLQNGESFSIEITSVGCFGGTRQTVVVTKEAGVFTVNFLDISKVLTDVDIAAFRIFELQLRSLQRGGCTTVDTYVVRYGNEEFRTSDGTCSWLGGKKLLEAIS